MTVIEDFIWTLEGEEQQIVVSIHEWLSNWPGIETKIRYKVPFYYGRSWICYLNPLKKGGVELAFIRGNELSEESKKLLNNKGRKQVYGLDFLNTKKMDWTLIQLIFEEAVKLDREVKYQSKRKK